jgi:ppGpp synthetase/RelA/SpoT-type nucleotidyltranferase
MNEQDLLFYGQYKDYVRNLETQLLSDISAILQPINQRPEDKIIKYTTSRIKSANSTIEKLKRNGHEPTVDSAMIYLSDIVGARLVVRFIRDVYTIRNMLVDSGKFTIVKEKDYVKNGWIVINDPYQSPVNANAFVRK